jgi:hypothetical protein
MTTETDAQPGDAEQTSATTQDQATDQTTQAGAEAGGEGQSADAQGQEGQKSDAEPKREPWFQKRIDKLTHDKRELERQLQAATELIRSRSEGQQDAQEGQQGQPLTEAEVERRAAAKAAQELAKRDAEAAERAFVERCNKIYQDGSSEFQDFPDAVAQLNSAGVMDREFLDSVLETDAPAKVLHHLGSNPEEAMRIAALPPKKQVLELDRLAAKVAKPPAREVSKTPAPVNPLAGAAKAAFDPNSPDADMREWMKWREQQLAAKSRR